MSTIATVDAYLLAAIRAARQRAQAMQGRAERARSPMMRLWFVGVVAGYEREIDELVGRFGTPLAVLFGAAS